MVFDVRKVFNRSRGLAEENACHATYMIDYLGNLNSQLLLLS